MHLVPGFERIRGKMGIDQHEITMQNCPNFSISAYTHKKLSQQLQSNHTLTKVESGMLGGKIRG